MADTTAEVVWLRQVQSDLGIRLSLLIPLFCNKTAINISDNEAFHECTKHNEHYHHGTISPPFVSTNALISSPKVKR